jgi:4-alpha-glucanotransferase
VLVIGDAPIFVAYDSADVWCNRHLFQLDEAGKPLAVAGVPPDYFSKTGQLWGNPLYDWERLAADGYGWWRARLQNDLWLYDLVRIDHFRGFEASWSVPYGQKTAVNGEWVKGPGEPLFQAIRQAIGSLPIIAEDLGVITPAVEELRDRFQLPGMKILQFAFDGGAANSYLPHNYLPNCVVYTGTHDNDTTRGWFTNLTEPQQQRVLAYLHCPEAELVWAMLRLSQSSVARYAVMPFQDLLELDSSARMNVPGVAAGNWEWRLPAGGCKAGLAERLYSMSAMFNRIGR